MSTIFNLAVKAVVGLVISIIIMRTFRLIALFLPREWIMENGRFKPLVRHALGSSLFIERLITPFLIIWVVVLVVAWCFV